MSSHLKGVTQDASAIHKLFSVYLCKRLDIAGWPHAPPIPIGGSFPSYGRFVVTFVYVYESLHAYCSESDTFSRGLPISIYTSEEIPCHISGSRLPLSFVLGPSIHPPSLFLSPLVSQLLFLVLSSPFCPSLSVCRRMQRRYEGSDDALAAILPQSEVQ